MNVEKLIAAANKIVAKMEAQEQRTKRISELASMAQKVVPDSREHIALKNEMNAISLNCNDYGDVLFELRRAVKAPATKINKNR